MNVLPYVISWYLTAEFPSSTPLSCQNNVTGENGICTYKWSCNHGIKIGSCSYESVEGICCKIPEDADLVSNGKVVAGEEIHDIQEKSKLPATLKRMLSERIPVTVNPLHDMRRPVAGESSHNIRLPVVFAHHHNHRQPVKVNEFHSLLNPLLPDESHDQRWPVLNEDTHDQRTPVEVQYPEDSSDFVPSENVRISGMESNATVFPFEFRAAELPLHPKLSLEELSKVCGESKDNLMGRLVGGVQSEYLKWPWMISLLRRIAEGYPFEHKCGAVLLNDFWFITAAHCIYGQSLENIRARLGEHDLHENNEMHPHVERTIYMAVVHPHFDPDTYENDLAILRFHDSVQFEVNVIPICLPKVDNVLAGRVAVVAGWGRLSEGGELPGALYEVYLPILTNEDCEKLYSEAGFSEVIADVFICAGFSIGGSDACDGDSGGPLMLLEQNKWTLIGLVSWGKVCAAPKQPGVYTRIIKYIDWIEEIIGF